MLFIRFEEQVQNGICICKSQFQIVWQDSLVIKLWLTLPHWPPKDAYVGHYVYQHFGPQQDFSTTAGQMSYFFRSLMIFRVMTLVTFDLLSSTWISQNSKILVSVKFEKNGKLLPGYVWYFVLLILNKTVLMTPWAFLLSTKFHCNKN